MGSTKKCHNEVPYKCPLTNANQFEKKHGHKKSKKDVLKSLKRCLRSPDFRLILIMLMS